MDKLDWKIRRFLVDEGYLFPITDAEIERALKELEIMSAHNHDEEIMRRFNTRRGKILQEKAGEALDAKISEAVLNCDISGMTPKAAKAKLNLVISAVVKSHFG